jgi:predicted nucleotidyltransferase
MISVMNRDQIIAVLRAHEPELRHRGVLHAALFGSVARDEGKPGSDIDIMIELADLFPNKVDVANRSRLKPLVRPQAERDALYAF